MASLIRLLTIGLLAAAIVSAAAVGQVNHSRPAMADEFDYHTDPDVAPLLDFFADETGNSTPYE